MKKILITGATGLLGKHIIRKLKKQFYIYAISREKKIDEQDLKWIKLDFSKNWNISSLPSRIDIIIHAVQSEKFRDFPESSVEIFNINTFSTLRLLEYGRIVKAKKFIYISSGGVGDLYKNISDISFYLTSKLSSELLVKNYQSFFDTVIIRPFFIYGPGSKKTLLIPRLIDLIQNNKPVLLHGKEGIRINPIYIKDAVEAIVKSINLKGNHTVDLAGNEILSIKEIAVIIGDQLKIPPHFKNLDSVRVDLLGDNLQTAKILYKPKIKFKDGIEKVLKEYD